MKILWLSPTPGLLHEGEGTGGYGGSGWIGALQHLFMASQTDHLLALAFPDEAATKKTIQNGITYYPILVQKKSRLQKILHYYGGYKHYDKERYVKEVSSVIQDYHPDVIHLFGLENPFSSILGNTEVPIVTHLQGLLGPCENAFFPIDINSQSFSWPPTIREWVWRNGYQFAKKELHVSALKEKELFRHCQYFMGRTDFDYQVSQLMAPGSHYHKVNEALRPCFYDKAGQWHPGEGKLIITSTISETVYKGLDLILKTANLLKQETDIDFEWQVVGIGQQSNFVRFFEKFLHIKSAEVNVRYMGVLSAEQLSSNSLSASVYVHPSYIDNSPNSVCEAQLLGSPVIATNVGGVSSLIEHKKTGLLVPANAPYELAYWLKYLSVNADFAKQLSHNGYEAAKVRHDKNTIIRDLIATYETIASQKR